MPVVSAELENRKNHRPIIFIRTLEPQPKTSGAERAMTSSSTASALWSSIPLWTVVLVASLDNADKQLLGSSFPMLEETLGLDTATLGYFSLLTNLSYALSLPLWGYLVHIGGIFNLHKLLSRACAAWGLATFGIALFGRSVLGQAFFRALTGACLGSILPLSQTLLVEIVPSSSLRGRAFGLMGICEKLAGTLAASSVVYFQQHWELSYYILGVFSLIVALTASTVLHPSRRGCISQSNYPSMNASTKEKQLSIRQIVKKILAMPPFLCLVAQGIFGGTPWDMMSFLLLLMDWRGFSKEQIVSIQFASGAASMIGGWIGGVFGDYANGKAGAQGRIAVAICSKVIGTPLYGLFLYARSYEMAMFYLVLFQLTATWCVAAALRPLCADLTSNPSERAQIVSLWYVLEKSAGAVFGAPLVGYLTKNMLSKIEENHIGEVSEEEKSHALAFNLFVLSSLFWFLCGMCWVIMMITVRRGHYPQLNTKSFATSKKDNDKNLSDDEAAALL